MFQNIKVDIIYYKTNTDFELEFNLCGCCRMRLLTDKAPDKKTLVHDLARAVSRSRVILIAGSLFGEDGIIEIIARAISKTLTEVDSRLYGISDGSSIKIINGATPLVTPEGYFGGCIIESGPQAMILLTDNKAVRKTVMNTLIHPYIEELCALELKEKAQAAQSAASSAEIPAAPADDVIETDSAVTAVTGPSAAPSSEKSEENYQETAESDEALKEQNPAQSGADSAEPADFPAFYGEENAGNPGIAEPSKPLDFFASKQDGVTLSGGMRYESTGSGSSFADEEETDSYLSTEKAKNPRGNRFKEPESYSDERDAYYQYDSGYPEESRTGKSGNKAMLIISILLLIILAVLCYCIFYVPAREGMSLAEYLQETFGVLLG